MAQTVAKYLGYFGKKMCSQDLSKIAQSGHTEREDKISATFEAKSETNGIIRRQPNLGSSPETTWFSDFVSLTASIPPNGTSRTGGPNIATFIYLSIATLTRATKFFLIYEKFQLQRFYRKLADFAAGGRYGGLTIASQCVRKRTGSERRGGGRGVRAETISNLNFGRLISMVSFSPSLPPIVCPKLRPFSCFWGTPWELPSPAPPSSGTGCTKWLISEHNQISQYVPLYGVSHSAVQLFNKDFEGCPAHSTNKTRHPKCYPI